MNNEYEKLLFEEVYKKKPNFEIMNLPAAEAQAALAAGYLVSAT